MLVMVKVGCLPCAEVATLKMEPCTFILTLQVFSYKIFNFGVGVKGGNP